MFILLQPFSAAAELESFLMQSKLTVLRTVTNNSGGSRGGSQGAMDPPFQAEHCMQKQDSQQLTEVQQSLPASTSVLSVQSSYKQSL